MGGGVVGGVGLLDPCELPKLALVLSVVPPLGTIGGIGRDCVVVETTGKFESFR